MTIKSSLNHYQQKQLQQVRYLQEAADAYINRSKSTSLRKHVLEKQRVRNYQSEYERLRNHLEQASVTPFQNKASITNRVAHLKSLGAKALDNIQ